MSPGNTFRFQIILRFLITKACCLLKVSKSQIRFAEFIIHRAPARECTGILSVQADRLVKVIKGFLVFFLAIVQHASVVISLKKEGSLSIAKVSTSMASCVLPALINWNDFW